METRPPTFLHNSSKRVHRHSSQFRPPMEVFIIKIQHNTVAHITTATILCNLSGKDRFCDCCHNFMMEHKRRSDLLCPQVFLSHSGKQKNFARHLFKEMERENISCFFDDDPQSLRIAEEFSPRIFEAAMNCKVSIVVLSEEFISTKWPMLELSAFVKAQNSSNTSLKILPLFFAMSPDALAQKLQNKDFLKSWQELQISQRRLINFDEWIKALEKLRGINGIKYMQSEGEVAYIHKIVVHIRDMLPPRLIYDESDAGASS